MPETRPPRPTAEDFLYPAIEPNASGMLALDGLHTLYWEESGNSQGVAAVFLRQVLAQDLLPVAQRLTAEPA